MKQTTETRRPLKTMAQNHYGKIEIDLSEKDVIVIWGNIGTEDIQRVHICRENLNQFIKILQDEQAKEK